MWPILENLAILFPVFLMLHAITLYASVRSTRTVTLLSCFRHASVLLPSRFCPASVRFSHLGHSSRFGYTSHASPAFAMPPSSFCRAFLPVLFPHSHSQNSTSSGYNTGNTLYLSINPPHSITVYPSLSIASITGCAGLLPLNGTNANHIR